MVPQELERCRADLQKARAEVDKFKENLDKKTMEIVLLKKSKQELEAEQKYEIDRLKDQSRKDKEELTKVHERAKQVCVYFWRYIMNEVAYFCAFNSKYLSSNVFFLNHRQLAEPSLVEALRGELGDARGEAEQLRSQLLSVKEELQSERDRLCSLQIKANALMHESGELEGDNIRMKEKISRLEVRTQ